jgi:hypothetical protein
MDYFQITPEGRIDSSFTTNLLFVPQQEGISGDTHYYDFVLGDFAVRQAPGIIVDGKALSNLPGSGSVSVSGPITLEAQYGTPELTLQFDLPGTYTIRIVPNDIQWLPFETEIVQEVE